ncbi:MAG: type II toxin-antitoxin system MqsA family antitoxin [Campylobacterota bacterium]
MEACAVCGGKLVEESRKSSFQYKTHTIEIEMPGLYCEECGEGYHNEEEQKTIDRNIALAKRHTEHLLIPDELVRIRKKLQLSQKEAAEILGGGVRSFYKYEHVLNNQPKSLDILFRLLDDGVLSWEDVVLASGKSA